MIAQIANRGTSFKGAGLYYLHDKKAETSERVAWTQTRNLQTDNPDMALRVMAFTAMDKDRLKAQAGISNTGRKSKGEVYSYSLAWHPEEKGKFDKSQMLEAADQSLKALGAQNHQAVIVAHQDEKHPHIHIIVNMVNPENGKNLTVSNDRKKLHKWSNDWRKERGEEHLYTPNKAKKFEAIEAKKRGQKVPYMNKGKSNPRNLYESFEQAKKTLSPNDVRKIREEQAQKDKALSDAGKKMHNRHSNEWAALSDNYKLQKNYIQKEFYRERAEIKAEIFEANKPIYSELLRQHRNQTYKQKERNKRLVGMVQTALNNVKLAKESGEKNNVISALFDVVVNGGMEQLKKQHAKEIREFKADQNAMTRHAIDGLKQQRNNRLSSARGQFSHDRQSLINKQRDEKNDLKNRWKSRNERRKLATQGIVKKAAMRSQDREKSGMTEEEILQAKEKFKEKAVQPKAKRTRSRKRSRKRDNE